MRRLMIKVVVAGVALGGIALYSEYDKATNYQKTQVKVTSVEEICYMKKTEGKESWTTEEGPCPVIEAVHQSHPEFREYDLKRVVHVGYEYQSPADGRWHQGKHRQAKHDDGRDIRRGDDLVVLLHKQDPEKTRKF